MSTAPRSTADRAGAPRRSEIRRRPCAGTIWVAAGGAALAAAAAVAGGATAAAWVLAGSILGLVAARCRCRPTDVFAEAFSASKAGLMIVGADGAVVHANAASRRIFAREDLAGVPLVQLVPTLTADADDPVPTADHVAMLPDGALRPIAVHVDRLADRGAGARRMVVAVDVSELRAAEQRLLLQNNLLQSASSALFDAKVSAEEATRRKTRFLTHASHEIRTPLTAILGFAEQLQDDTLGPEERSEAIRIVRRNGEHLLTVLDDLLDLAKIEADELAVRHASCDLRAIVEEVAELFTLTLREQRMSLVVDAHTPLPPAVVTDRSRVRQVLVNVIGEVLRARPPASGGVLRIALAATATPAQVRIAIESDLPFRTPAELGRMFEPFGDNDPASRPGGLGLAIGRRLARLLGGDLVAYASPPAGTTFVFTFDPGPLPDPTSWTVARPGRTGSAVESPLAGRRILVAEDGRDNQRLLTAILRRAGATVAIAEDGARAVDAVRRATRDAQPFDAVVMDMQMPVLDGYAATAHLRRAGCELPILALTADALSGARRRCIEAGCDDYATKPIDRQRLIATLQALLDGRSARAVGAATAP